MPTQINIKRVNGKVVFEEASLTQSGSVFWVNQDPNEPHWPVWKISLNQLGPYPSPPSSAFPAYPQAPPMTIFYGCAIAGHEAEQGQINVYNDFAPDASPLPDATLQQPYNTTVATGGMSPYNVGAVAGQVPPGLTLAGASNNGGITLSGTPTQAGTYTFTLLGATDNLQNSIAQQAFTITVA